MGYGFRVFLVEEDNSIKRIPTAKFDRLWQPDNNDQWQPYANKSIRYAQVRRSAGRLRLVWAS